MSEKENQEQQTQKTIATDGEVKSGNATPTPRAVKMIDEVRSAVKPLPLTKKNWSWPSFIIVLAYIVAMAVVSMSNISVTGEGNRIGFLIGTFFVGSLAGVIVYNLGKLIAAKLSGYTCTYVCVSGICWDGSRSSHRWYCDFSQFLEIHSRFAPDAKKNDTREKIISRDPLIMSLGGPILFLVAFAVVLGVSLGILRGSLQDILLYGAVFSADYFIYQLCPFRQDYPSDMFTIVSTRKAEDRIAYNVCQYNRGYEFSDKEMLVAEASDYDSYWKAESLIYVMRDRLYKADIPAVISIFTQLHAVSNWFNDEDKGQIAGERLFVLLLLNDLAGADKLFLELPKAVKNESTRSKTLASYRTSLMVNGLIVRNEEGSKENVNEMLKSASATAESVKIKTERRYYRDRKSVV